MTMIQVLSLTISLDKETVIVLDALRKQRNVADYSGHIVPASAVDECVKCAENLLHDVNHWLLENKSELVL